MTLSKYLSKKKNILLPDKELCRSLSHEDLKLAGEKIKECLEAGKLMQSKSKRGKYNHYDAEKKAQIGKYTSENKPTARRPKVEYLNKLKEIKNNYNDESIPVVQLNRKDGP